MVGGRGGGGVWLGLVIFFKESKSEKKNHFLEGVKVREDWLV